MSDDGSLNTTPSLTPTYASSVSSVTMTTATSRSTDFGDLKELKAPEEGGTKKEYEDFLERIANHITVSWPYGRDISDTMSDGQRPDIEEPKDLTAAEEKSRFKVRQWESKVDRYMDRVNALDENCKALFSVFMDSVSKIVKAKLKSKPEFIEKEAEGKVEWLVGALENIMLKFEEIIPNTLAMDDQLERIVKFRQGNLSNEDYIKAVRKEIKIFEKHGGRYLWGTKQDAKLSKRLKEA